jgi:hypothetical protein
MNIERRSGGGGEIRTHDSTEHLWPNEYTYESVFIKIHLNACEHYAIHYA